MPMLPAGKYVVEVVMPPGYELVKEEDKNILIGDSFIAPVTQQFGPLGEVFIIPDQASVASANNPGPGYNANNPQNPTQGLGTTPRTGTVPSYPFEPIWPCVGEARVVPDYMSIFPQSFEVAPFAGATRNLCDRKEVTLDDQRAAIAKFFIYTSTHIAAKFTGIITDDFTSEFDPFAPTFGEKFSPPNLPVSLRDFNGNEVSRVYSDQWGAFNGLSYSTWEVNPPNPTGYSPTMMVTCMNDAGPILDTNPASPTYNQMITDPLFNPLYSQFCYELPFMPGVADYMDTPVVPTAGFVGAGYNNPDCSYPTLTPAVKEVDGDGVGPWVSAPGHRITIAALGDQPVSNYGYSGPLGPDGAFQSEDRHAPLRLRNSMHSANRGQPDLQHRVERYHRRSCRDHRELERHLDRRYRARQCAGVRRPATNSVRRPRPQRPRRSFDPVRPVGDHGRQREAVGGHGYGHGARQDAQARGRLGLDSGRDQRRRSGRPDHRRPELHHDHGLV